MRNRPYRVAALGWLLLSAAAAAEPIVIGETRTLASQILGEERGLMIHLPPGYGRGAERYPVLYLLDGRDHFHHATGTADTLALTGRIPELIVVGLANTDRTRDFAPSWTQPDPPESRRRAVAAAGGADRFLEFFEKELIPSIDRGYRTHPFRILVGHSLGGLFVVHALATAPETFDAYVAISPGLTWDNGLPVRRLLDRFGQSPGLETFFYATHGDEGGDSQTWFLRLKEVLRHHAPPGLRWGAGIYLEETHGTVPLRTVEQALDALYERYPVPVVARAQGLDAVLGHFAGLSEDFGYPMEPGERLINELGYWSLRDGDGTRALAAFKYNVARHSESANAHDSLAEALEAAGRLKEARRSYERAVTLGRESGDPALRFFEEHLRALEEKLAGGG